jgi:hypothetical protein
LGALARRLDDALGRRQRGFLVSQPGFGHRRQTRSIDPIDRTHSNIAITDLARAIRRNIIGALERMTGLEVVEVSVSVNDVHLPSDDDDKEQAPGGPPRVT